MENFCFEARTSQQQVPRGPSNGNMPSMMIDFKMIYRRATKKNKCDICATLVANPPPRGPGQSQTSARKEIPHRRVSDQASDTAKASSCCPFLLVDVVLEKKLAVGRNVPPSVDVEYGSVHSTVQLPELLDL